MPTNSLDDNHLSAGAKPDDPPPDNPLLTRASITFHTNDDDKNNDTTVNVVLAREGETIAYISDVFGKFPDHSDAGPFTLLMKSPLGRDEVRNASVTISIEVPDGLFGGDTWRFNFLLDLFFVDGSHLISKGSNIELAGNSEQQFAVE